MENKEPEKKQLEDAVNEYKLNAMKLNELKAKITHSEVDVVTPWVAYKCTPYSGDCIFVVIRDDLSSRKNIDKQKEKLFKRLEKDKVYAVLNSRDIKSDYIEKIERYKYGD